MQWTSEHVITIDFSHIHVVSRAYSCQQASESRMPGRQRAGGKQDESDSSKEDRREWTPPPRERQHWVSKADPMTDHHPQRARAERERGPASRRRGVQESDSYTPLYGENSGIESDPIRDEHMSGKDGDGMGDLAWLEDAMTMELEVFYIHE